MNQLSDFHRERVQAVLNASPLVPVITINHPDEALPLCQALLMVAFEYWKSPCVPLMA